MLTVNYNSLRSSTWQCMVAKTTRKKTDETVKKELLDCLKENYDLEEPDLDITADTITDPIDAVRIIQRYEEIIKQRQLLKKFRETEQFLENVGQSKSTVCFEIGLHKFLKKYPMLKKQLYHPITSTRNL